MSDAVEDAFEQAIENDDLDAVKNFLSANSIDQQSLGDFLFVAVLQDKEAIIAALLDAGASVERADTCTPLSLNFVTDNERILKMLEDERARQEGQANMYRLQSEFKKAGLSLTIEQTKTAVKIVQDFGMPSPKQ